MHNLLRCRRGSAAFATVVALVPLIGVVALGGEAGSWYVTKQHAQNAADAAAYSGGLKLACDNVAPCADTKSVDYRGKQFAAQNTFCNGGDTTSYPGRRCATSLPTGTSQTVQINTLTAWNGVNGNFVQATVSQQQPTYLAKLLGLSTVNIGATAVAAIKNQIKPCVLALGGPITFQDNGVDINAPTCGLASNYAGPGPSIDFGPVKPSNIDIGPSAAVGGCKGDATLCQKVSTYLPPVTNPYAAGLDAAISALTLRDCTAADRTAQGQPPGAPVAYTAAQNCANRDFSINGSASFTLKGTYFFSGTEFTMKGSSSKMTTDPAGASLILLPGVTTGKSNHIDVTVSAPTTTPTVLPPSLMPYAALIGNTAIYNTETDAKKFTGGTSFTTGRITSGCSGGLTFFGRPSAGARTGAGRVLGFLRQVGACHSGASTLTQPQLSPAIGVSRGIRLKTTGPR
jgi:hypothetical protein